MSEEIDQSSFASILAGVQKIRDQYELLPRPKRPFPRTGQSPEVTKEGPRSVTSNTANTDSTTGTSTDHHKTEINDTVSASSGSSPAAAATIASRSVPVSGSAKSKRSRPTHNVHSYTQVQVAQSQKGNPLLESPSMKMTPWSFNGLVLLDYYINATIQVLFLSLKYHKLRPEYVWRRIEKLKGGSSSADVDSNDQALRVLLVVVDIDSPQDALCSLLVLCVKNDLTLVIAWSFDEAGNYIAYLKLNEMARSKVSSSIQGIKKGDFNSNIVETLTTVRAINKTDVANLLANCKSFKDIVLAATNENGLKQIPGLGDRKVQNLKTIFSNPFIFNKEIQEPDT